MEAPLAEKPTIETHPLVKWSMLALGLASVLTATLILLGWIPLGERANILRSHTNQIEYAAMIGCILFGIASFRAYVGLQQNDSAGISYSRWLSFFTIFIGLTFVASVVIPSFLKYTLLPEPETTPVELQLFSAGLLLSFIGILGVVYRISVRAGLVGRSVGNTLNFPIRGALILFGIGLLIAIPANLAYVVQFPDLVPNIRPPDPTRLIPGMSLFLIGWFTYREVTRGEEESDDLRRAVSMAPGKFVQVQLAKSPSAGAIIGFIVIFLAFTMATDLFLEGSSIASILTNVSSKGIIAIGVTILMISGEFDLSVGSILGVVAMMFMQFMTGGAPILGVMDPLPAALLAIFVGAILGFINGFILVTTGIPSFIVTLGTMLAYRSISLVAIAGGRILRYRDFYDEFPHVTLSPWLFVILSLIGLGLLLYAAYQVLPVLWQRFAQDWGRRYNNGDFGTTIAIWGGAVALVVTLVLTMVGAWLVALVLHYIGNPESIQAGFFDIVNGRWEGTFLMGPDSVFAVDVPRTANYRLAIVWWLIFVIFFNIILTSTPYGNASFAVGGNVGAARAQGINVAYVKVSNFVLTATLTGVAAIYETARNPGVDPLKGNQWELEVIAMTVIGGALLTGGYGSVVGSLLGALIFGMLQTGLVLVGIESRLFTGTIGVVIIVAVVLNTAVRGARKT